MSYDQARDLAAGYVIGALEHPRRRPSATTSTRASSRIPSSRRFGEVIPALLELGDPSWSNRRPRSAIGSWPRRPPTRSGAGAVAAAAAARLRGGPRRSTRERSARDRSTRPLRRDPLPEAAERAASHAGQRPAGSTGRCGSRRCSRSLAVGGVGAQSPGQLDGRSVRPGDCRGGPRGRPARREDRDPLGRKDYEASGIAAVEPDGSIVLAIRDLPATSGGKVVTTWVIVGSNAPVAVGDFVQPAGGDAGMTTRPATTPAGATIALTLEPNAGNTAPQGPIVSAGVTAAPPGANG